MIKFCLVLTVLLLNSDSWVLLLKSPLTFLVLLFLPLLLAVSLIYWLNDFLNYKSDCKHIYFRLFLVRLEKVNFREVHADWFGQESFQKFHHKLKWDALTFWGACWGELGFVDTVDVKGDPVGMPHTIREEMSVNLTLHIWNHFGKAKSGVVPRDLMLLNHLVLFWFIRSNAEIDKVLKREYWLLLKTWHYAW